MYSSIESTCGSLLSTPVQNAQTDIQFLSEDTQTFHTTFLISPDSCATLHSAVSSVFREVKAEKDEHVLAA